MVILLLFSICSVTIVQTEAETVQKFHVGPAEFNIRAHILGKWQISTHLNSQKFIDMGVYKMMGRWAPIFLNISVFILLDIAMQ